MSGLIDSENTVMIMVDVQEKLFPAIWQKEIVRENCARLLDFAKIVELPLIVTEQYPKGIGRTLPDLQEKFETQIIEKTSFGCFGEEEFCDAVRQTGRKNLVVLGIETHVCICQTVLEGLARGYNVYVVADAVSSREKENRDVGVERMRRAGAVIVSTEMFIFEILKKAGTEQFKKALKLIK